MVTVRVIVTAPFRAVWFLITLPFLFILWLLALLRRAVWAIVRYAHTSFVSVCACGLQTHAWPVG